LIFKLTKINVILKVNYSNAQAKQNGVLQIYSSDKTIMN